MKITQLEGELKRQLAEDEAGQPLLPISGIGPVIASSQLGWLAMCRAA